MTLSEIRSELTFCATIMNSENHSPTTRLSYKNKWNNYKQREAELMAKATGIKKAGNSDSFVTLDMGSSAGFTFNSDSFSKSAMEQLSTPPKAKEKEKPSPVFGLFVGKNWGTGLEFPQSLYATVNNVYKTSGILLATNSHYTNIWVEKAILYCVLRTTFKDYTVTRGRYMFNFKDFDVRLIRSIIDHILKCKLNRINYSWVQPLQDLIIFPPKPKQKITKKKRNEEDYVSPPEPVGYMDEDEAPIKKHISPGFSSGITIAPPRKFSASLKQTINKHKQSIQEKYPWTLENAAVPVSPSISVKSVTDSEASGF